MDFTRWIHPLSLALFVTSSPLQIHSHLGYPTFHFLKNAIPSLIFNLLNMNSIGQINILGARYLETLKKVLVHPFSLVYSDVWDLSCISSTFIFQSFVSFIDNNPLHAEQLSSILIVVFCLKGGLLLLYCQLVFN